VNKTSRKWLAISCLLSVASAIAGGLIAELNLLESTGMFGRGDELPDSVRYDSVSEMKQRQAEGAISIITGHAAVIAPRDPTVRGNCIAALEQIRLLKDSSAAHPIVFDGRITRSNDQWFLLISSLNCHRETDQVIVVGATPNGEIVKMIVQFPLTCKDPSIVAGITIPVKYEPISRIVSSGRGQSPGEIVVSQEYAPDTIMSLPESLPLAVAIRDRSGLISNFVSVRQERREEGARSGKPGCPGLR